MSLKSTLRILQLPGLFVTALVVFFLIFKSIVYTPAIPRARGRQSLAELVRIPVNGAHQWLLIRSEDIRNPLLLYLHSGPGTTELIPFRQYQQALEQFFTIVVWEQRGTGKSFSPSLAATNMTINQLLADGRAVTAYLCKRFKQGKVLLVGHSWGSALGMLLVRNHPALYHAFVGCGQMVHPARGEQIGYHYCLRRARGLPRAQQELLALDRPRPYLSIDPQGHWFEKLKTQRKWLLTLGGELYGRKDYGLLFNWNTIMQPEYSWLDFVQFAQGSTFSLKQLWPEVMHLNLLRQVPRLNVPVFFLQGKHDYLTPGVLVERYFEKLQAPHKELIWFHVSGHHPLYEERRKFQNILIKRVRPRCLQQSKPGLKKGVKSAG